MEYLLPSSVPIQFFEVAKNTALLSERSTAQFRNFLLTLCGGMPQDYYLQAAWMQGIHVDVTDGILSVRLPALLLKKARTEGFKFLQPALHAALKQYTLTLMKNYRDALWNVEVAERNLHAEFHAAYGASNRASLDDLALPNPHLEGYAQSISRSKKMLSVIDSSVNLMREKHKKGELYYWILYYSYLSPQRYENANEILYALDGKGFTLSIRYYSRREETLSILSSVLWGYTSVECNDILDLFIVD